MSKFLKIYFNKKKNMKRSKKKEQLLNINENKETNSFLASL